MNLATSSSPVAGGRRAHDAARRRPLPRARRPDVGRQRGPRPHRRHQPRDPRRRAGRHRHPRAVRAPGAATRPASTSRSASRSTAPAVPAASRSPPRSPSPGDLITLTMRANPDGIVSKHLVNDARVGDVIHLSQAEGDVHPAQPAAAQVLLISGGSGITPVMSILRTLLRRGYGGTVTFLHYAQSPDHQIYADELADLPPNVHVHLRLPRGRRPARSTAPTSWPGSSRSTPTSTPGPAGRPASSSWCRTPSPTTRGCGWSTSRPPRSGRSTAPRAAPGSTAPARRPRTPAPRCWSRPRRSGCGRSSAAGWASASPARPARRKARCATSSPASESSQPDEDIQICVSAPLGDCVVDL